MRALPRSPFPRVVQRPQRGDGDVYTGQHEVQIPKDLERRGIGISRWRHGPAQRSRDDIGCQVVTPGAFLAERRDLHHYQLRPARQGGVKALLFRAERPRAAKHDVRPVDQCIELRVSRFAIEIQTEEAPRRRKERMPQRIGSLRRAFEARSAAAQRVSPWRFGAHNIRTEIRQQFSTKDAALVGQIDDAHLIQGAVGFRHWQARF